MRKVIITLLVSMSVSIIGCEAKKEAPLVQVESKNYGDVNNNAVATELERNGNTSKIKVVFKKRGSSVGDSMFVMMAICEAAKARNYEYFCNLKEWDDKDGAIYVAGFTNKKDADIKKEFGKEYDYKNESGQQRSPMSVTQLKEFMEKIKTGASTNQRR